MHREFVDSKTGKPVDARDQVKDYETGRSDYFTFEPDEIACKPGLNIAAASARSLCDEGRV